jgi:hypothetical protein
MNRLKTVVHLILVLAVATSLSAFFIPTEAKAYTFQREVLESWGYVVNGTPQCSYPGFGTLQVVGAEIWDECSQTGCSWGISCAVWTQRFEACKTGCP